MTESADLKSGYLANFNLELEPPSKASHLFQPKLLVSSHPMAFKMSPKNLYLLAYNSVSYLLWLYLSFKACSSIFSPFLHSDNSSGTNSNAKLLSIYHNLLPTLTITQSLAVLEVLHAACGLVRASPVTTAIQVGGKNLVVWTVMRRFPHLVANVQKGGIWGFVGCVLAWGVSEMIRYGFFVVQIVRGEAPGWMKWLR